MVKVSDQWKIKEVGLGQNSEISSSPYHILFFYIYFYLIGCDFVN